jgi:hypothetical protein
MSCSAQDGGSGIAQIAANHVPAMGGHTKRGVRDMGAPGQWAAKHGPGIGPLKEGKLVRLGYSATKGKTARHRALKKAVKRYGSLSTFRKLNAAATYTKRTSKGRSRTFKADRNWVKKSYM